VIEQALETALKLGKDKSRGYCLEINLRGFLSGSKPGQWKPGVAVAINLKVFQIPARRTEAGVRGTNRESILNRIPIKDPRLRLDPVLYEHLRRQVLRRDGWRCQSCGAISNLEVHHKRFRSQSGDDSERNLITLCAACHGDVHRGFGGNSLELE